MKSCDRQTLGIVIVFEPQKLLSASLHLCRGKFLDYETEGINERVQIRPKPSVRAQVTRIVKQILSEWTPAKVFIGTGDPDEPRLIKMLTLPRFWEERTAVD